MPCPTPARRPRSGSPGLGHPLRRGLIKNRYVGRTFIQPDQALRQHGIRLKFNPLRRDRRAAARGRRRLDRARQHHAADRRDARRRRRRRGAHAHLVPADRRPCFYGIDMADRGRARRRPPLGRGDRERIGATSLPYLSLEGLQAATRLPAGSVLPRLLHRRVPDRDPRSRRSRCGSSRCGVSAVTGFSAVCLGFAARGPARRR